MKAVMSVIRKDIVGIPTGVSAEYGNVNINVIEVSQILLQDMFVMIVLIDITKGNMTLTDPAAHMENVGKQSGLTIHVTHEDILNSMYRMWDGEHIANAYDILEIMKMIDEEHLNVCTITMGISLLDCCDSNIDKPCEEIYNKIIRLAKNLVKTGEDIERGYGIPIINKRISVTSIAMFVAVGSGGPVKYAYTLEHCVQAVSVSLIGGCSALVQKGYATGDRELMESIPRTLAEIERIRASVNVGSTRAGINMNAAELMGRMVKEAAELTRDRNHIDAARLVVFCNVPEDSLFMADAFHDVGETDCVINVGVSGPGVVRAALAKTDESLPMNEPADIIKKTASRVTRIGQLVGTPTSGRPDIPFGIVDLSLAPTPAIGDPATYILEEMGLESCSVYGTTTRLAIPSDVVKESGVTANSTVDGLSSTSIPVDENAGMIAATRVDTLCLEKLEAMTAICSIGLNMIVTPDETVPETISDIAADRTAIDMVNFKAIAVHVIPTIGKKAGRELEFGGLLGSGPVTNINQTDRSVMIRRKGRILTPIQALKN